MGHKPWRPVCECFWCAGLFESRRRNTLFCSSRCRNQERYHRKRREDGKAPRAVFFRLVSRPLKHGLKAI